MENRKALSALGFFFKGPFSVCRSGLGLGLRLSGLGLRVEALGFRVEG